MIRIFKNLKKRDWIGFYDYLHTHCNEHLHLNHVVGGTRDKARGRELVYLGV